MDPPIMTPKRLSRNIHTNVWEPTQASVGQSFFLPHTRRWRAAAGAAAAGEGGREKRAPISAAFAFAQREGEWTEERGKTQERGERGKGGSWLLACVDDSVRTTGQTIEGGARVKNRVSALCVE